jgi:hypothetical protein
MRLLAANVIVGARRPDDGRAVVGSEAHPHERRFFLLLDRWTKRKLRLKEDKLKQYVHQNLSFLFTEWRATFVSNEEYSPRGGVVHATLEVGQLRLKFVSLRDGSYTEVAAKHAPKQWEEISTVLKAIQGDRQVDDPERVPHNLTYLPNSMLAPLLKRHLPSLQTGLSEPNHVATWRAIEALKHIERQEYAQQMEKRVRDASMAADRNIPIGGD